MERHGVASIEGGRHPGWGTANRIVPLDDAYLELVAVVDADEAARSTFGSWIAASQSAGLRPLGWAVRTQGLDLIARRLDLSVDCGSRLGRDGRLSSWRLAGVEQAVAEPARPFFIEWGRDTPLPGRAAVAHPARDVGISELRLEGDADHLADWLGPHRLPITVRPGAPSVASVVLRTATGEIVI